MRKIKFTLNQQKANRDNLITALRSGKYEPVVVDGAFNPNGYTLGGVAWHLAGIGRDEHFNAFETYLVDDLHDFYGFKNSWGGYIINGEKYGLLSQNTLTFTEIANIIESGPEGLLIKAEDYPTWEWAQDEDGSYCREVVNPYLDKKERILKINFKIETNDGAFKITKTVTDEMYKGGLKEALDWASVMIPDWARNEGLTRHVCDGEELAIV